MELTLAELDAQAAEILPARDTMLIISFASVSSRVNANSLAVSIVNKAAANQVANAAGATVYVSQSVTQGVS